MGIPAFYSPAGVNTFVETGGFPIKFKKGSKEVEEYTVPKEVYFNIFAWIFKDFFDKIKKIKKRVFNGREFIMEEAIRGDFSLIKAWKADTDGNLIMRKTAKNFNNDMAGASTITVAEVKSTNDGNFLNA